MGREVGYGVMKEKQGQQEISVYAVFYNIFFSKGILLSSKALNA